MRVAGIVLCGGQSRRMGRAKALLPWGGGTMFGEVVRRLQQAVRPVVVVAAPEQALPTLPADVEVTFDSRPGRGPLQGLADGLSALQGRAEAAYLSGCDAPLLRPAFVARLIELMGDHLACVPQVEGRLHPMAAVYRLEALDAAERLLAENRLRSTLLFELLPTRFVRPEELREVDPELRSLRNLNAPEDYEAAVRELGIKPQIPPPPGPG